MPCLFGKHCTLQHFLAALSADCLPPPRCCFVKQLLIPSDDCYACTCRGGCVDSMSCHQGSVNTPRLRCIETSLQAALPHASIHWHSSSLELTFLLCCVSRLLHDCQHQFLIPAAELPQPQQFLGNSKELAKANRQLLQPQRIDHDDGRNQDACKTAQLCSALSVASVILSV
jgi:hypothetical protein